MIRGAWVITGAAGQVGQVLRHGLRGVVERLRLLDVAPLEAETDTEEVVTADLRDLPQLTAAVRGAEGIVHLAAIGDEVAFDDLAAVNIHGTFHVMEAARRTQVRRVVFASSNHVTGWYPTTTRVDVTMPVRPDGFYGVSKVAGEALGRLYADKFGIEVACVRIGSCVAAPTEPRHRHTWLSHRDTVAAFTAAMSVPDLVFATFYGVSANTFGWWDLEAGRRIGFHPRDDAEDYMAAEPGEAGRAGRQGGAFAEGG